MQNGAPGIAVIMSKAVSHPCTIMRLNKLLFDSALAYCVVHSGLDQLVQQLPHNKLKKQVCSALLLMLVWLQTCLLSSRICCSCLDIQDC